MNATVKREQHDAFSDVSTTPFWDLAVLLWTLAVGLGGGLAGIYALGYFLTGQPSLAWPMVCTAGGLLVVDVALRYGRSVARRNAW
jgi:hypothetical protein